MPSERLQKIIAAAGIASRRSAEKLIAGGLVEVNGKIVSELGSKADLEHDHIRVNGKLLHGAEPPVYLLMNKPKGYVTTVSDPERRPTVMDLLRGVRARVYPVGRLDYASEGLLLLTNDGELANLLMKASSHVPKTYMVKIAGTPVENGLEKLRRGITILNDRGQRVRTAPAKISSIRDAENPWYEVTLTEGKNRQIRKMFEEIGHHVEKIKRVRYGPMTLDVHPGEFRHLTAGEVEKLRAATRTPRPARSSGQQTFAPPKKAPAKAFHRKERPKTFDRKGRKETPQPFASPSKTPAKAFHRKEQPKSFDRKERKESLQTFAPRTKTPAKAFYRKEQPKTFDREERKEIPRGEFPRKENSQRPERKAGASASRDQSPRSRSSKQAPKHRSPGQSSPRPGSSSRRGGGSDRGKRRS